MIYFIFPLGFLASPLGLSLGARSTVWVAGRGEQLRFATPINGFIRVRAVSVTPRPNGCVHRVPSKPGCCLFHPACLLWQPWLSLQPGGEAVGICVASVRGQKCSCLSPTACVPSEVCRRKDVLPSSSGISLNRPTVKLMQKRPYAMHLAGESNAEIWRSAANIPFLLPGEAWHAGEEAVL